MRAAILIKFGDFQAHLALFILYGGSGLIVFLVVNELLEGLDHPIYVLKLPPAFLIKLKGPVIRHRGDA